MIPYGRQDISEDDRAAVAAVLSSDFLTQGPAVPRFESALCEATGAAHAVAVNSATSALHIATKALGLGEGDLLWTSPITFVASANCARYCGAEADFVDIDPDTFNMSPAALEEKLARAKRDGRLPKIVVPVHMGGQSADMSAIADLCRPHGIKVLEDASHAIGGHHVGQPVGACPYSDAAVFSFHPVKIVTTAEGGAVTTQDSQLAARMARLRTHGITREPGEMQAESHGPWYYEQIELGWNYRMTEMQAALGVSQMTRLNAFIDRRNALADRYDRLLADLPLAVPGRAPRTRSAFHLYVVRLHDPSIRRAVFEGLRAAGIGVNVHYIPVHLQPYWRDRGFSHGDFPVAEDYYERAISIPLYPGMSEGDQDRVVATLAAELSRHGS